MGKSMAGHILSAGYRLNVFNRTRSKADELVERGAVWHDSVGELARNSDVVITIVGYPKDVEELYLAADGIVAGCRSGSFLIDMTTSRPSLARRIHEAAKRRSAHSLDAPVSGGDIGARDGRLSIMVGGEEEDLQAVLPVLRTMGSNITLQGGPGAGQHTKLCNQIAIASTMIGLCEALSYAQKAGLSLDLVLQAMGAGAAQSSALNNLGPRILKGDFAPGFYVRHFIKDMNIAIEEASDMGLDPRGLKLAKQLYEELAREPGGEELGTQGLFKLFARELSRS